MITNICRSSARLHSSHQVYKMAVIDEVSVEWLQINVGLCAPQRSKCLVCWRGMKLQRGLRSLTTGGAHTNSQINSMMRSHPHSKESSLSPLPSPLSHKADWDHIRRRAHWRITEFNVAGNILYFKQKEKERENYACVLVQQLSSICWDEKKKVHDNSLLDSICLE